MTAEVTQFGVLSMQVCVPEDWQDDQVLAFAEAEYPCGTEKGWVIRREADPLLRGDSERTRCRQRAGHVHIMLDA